MSSTSFTALLLVRRLIGKSGQASLLRGIVNKIAEQSVNPPGPETPSRFLISSNNSGSGKNILYICLWKNPITDVSSLSRFSTSLYSQVSSICPSLDVRLLLKKPLPAKEFGSSSNSKASDSPVVTDKSIILSTSHSIDVLFLDSKIPKSDLSNFLLQNTNGGVIQAEQISQQVVLDIDESSASDDQEDVTGNGNNHAIDKLFDSVALGGTFDRIHNGHRLLLSEAVLRCKDELVIGVTDEEMVKTKSLHEMILPLESRLNSVKEFIGDITPNSIKIRVVPIGDPYGPAISEPQIQLLVLSQETQKGGDKINEIRRERGLPELLIHAIQLYPEPNKQASFEDDKISSSTQRIRNLGERLKPPNKDPSLPYVIGLTGGIASGKTNIAKYLVTLGAGVVNCDNLGHESYVKGTECFRKVVEAFGEDIVDPSTGEIIRKALGAKVFGKPGELKKLTDIVWPEIKRLAQQQIEEYARNEVKVVVLDAAVLFEAKWDTLCHEIWVTFIPRAEAIRRIQERDNLSREDGEKRIDSQLANKERLEKATFAFSSLWEVEFTRTQVRKAWNYIQNIISKL